MDWDKCQVCGGELVESPAKEWIFAHCVKCRALHGFDDDSGWFNLDDGDIKMRRKDFLLGMKKHFPPPQEFKETLLALIELIRSRRKK